MGREAPRIKSMYSSDYSRFKEILDSDEDDEGELAEDGVFSQKTHKALDECEELLAKDGEIGLGWEALRDLDEGGGLEALFDMFEDEKHFRSTQFYGQADETCLDDLD